MQGLRAVTPAAALRFRERPDGPRRLRARMAGPEPMGLEPAAGLRPELRVREAALPEVQRRPGAEVRWRAEAALAEPEARQRAEAPELEREARWRAEALLPERGARQREEAPELEREARQRAEALLPGREARQRAEALLPEREARQRAEAPPPEREARWRAEALLPEREPRQQTEAPPPEREPRQQTEAPLERKLRQRAEPPPGREPRQQAEPPLGQEPSPLTEPRLVQDPRRPVRAQPAPGAPGSPAMFREPPLRQADRAQPRGSALPVETARVLKARLAGLQAPERPETEPTAGSIWMRAAQRRTAKAAAPETEATAEPAEAGEMAGEAASRAQRTAIGAK